MREIIVFAAGAFAGAAGIVLLLSGFTGWPAEKRRQSGTAPHSHDASWLS